MFSRGRKWKDKRGSTQSLKLLYQTLFLLQSLREELSLPLVIPFLAPWRWQHLKFEGAHCGQSSWNVSIFVQGQQTYCIFFKA